MNFIKALKSGKPIRRKNKHTWTNKPSNDPWDSWVRPTTYNTLGNGYIDPEFFVSCIHFDIDDIIADDWEIKD